MMGKIPFSPLKVLHPQNRNPLLQRRHPAQAAPHHHLRAVAHGGGVNLDDGNLFEL
jgi:hypothetical protein